MVGFLLLFGGFAWLSWSTFMLGPISRAVLVAHYDLLPKATDTIYSREDIQKVMRDTMVDAFHKNPSFMLPGFTMLVGGLLLAFTHKRPPSHSNVA